MLSKRRAGALRASAWIKTRKSRRSRVFGPANLGKGAWPDGIAFDSYGNLWGTMVYSDKLFALTPEGDLRIILDEGGPQKGGCARAAVFQQSRDRRSSLCHGTKASLPGWQVVTFGGSDLRTAYIGSLKGKRIPYFRVPVPGLPMVHWKRRAMRSVFTKVPALTPKKIEAA